MSEPLFPLSETAFQLILFFGVGLGVTAMCLFMSQGFKESHRQMQSMNKEMRKMNRSLTRMNDSLEQATDRLWRHEGRISILEERQLSASGPSREGTSIH